MCWLNSSNIDDTRLDEETEREERVNALHLKYGDLGMLILSILGSVDPLGVPIDEYTGYAGRFIDEAGKHIVSQWKDQAGLVQEIVRRSFYASQVIPNQRGFVWVTEDQLKKISDSIKDAVGHPDGWEKYFPV
jgi:hypothetical protein